MQTHEIKDKDIIVIGSDGLWDNMFDANIIELIKPFLKDTDEIKDPEVVAEKVAIETEKLSLQTNYDSPFS